MLNEKVYIKKVNALAFLLFFLGIFILFFFQWLSIWAAASAAAFVAVTLRQFLIGKILDIFVSLLVFGALFFFNSYYFSELWTGIVLIIGSGYAFVRVCFDIYTDHLLLDKKPFYPKRKRPTYDEEEEEDPKD